MLLEQYKLKPIKLKDMGVSIYKGKSYNATELTVLDDVNSINYVTRTVKNNGVKYKVLDENFDFVETGNAITVGDTTATVFYQKERFIVGEHIIIIRADWLNECTGLFVTIQLQKESFRYPPYARAFILDCVKNTEILVPVKNDGTPDYESMTEYIKKLNIDSNNIIEQMPDYFLSEGYNKACRYLETIDRQAFENKYASVFSDTEIGLNTTKWGRFKLGDTKYFLMKRGASEYLKNMSIGDYPYISTTSENNGISTYVSEYNRDGNFITLAYDGSIGACFFQTGKFFASEKIVTISLASHELNVYIAMFIACILKLEAKMYSYGGRKWTVGQQMKQTEIKLPVDGKGEPDWDYMERYIKSLPFSQNLQ